MKLERKLRPISAIMGAALAMARQHGHLVRYDGGYWSTDRAPRDDNGIPANHFRISTVQGLVQRRLLEYSEWQYGGPRRRWRIPIACKPVGRVG